MSVISNRSSFWQRQSITCESRIVLMDNTCLKEKFENNSTLTGVAILRRIGEKLSIPQAELRHFGLKYPDTDGQMNWLPLSEAVKKLPLKKPYQFQLGVRVYPEANEQLSVNCLRLCCYQLKWDLNRGELFCSSAQHAAIDSYVAQAMIGDFDAKTHTPGYLEDYLGALFMTPSGLNCSGEVKARDYENDVVKRHRGHSKMTKKEAWLAILDVASTIPQFNVLRHKAKDCCDKTTVQISVFEQGVKIHKLNALGELDDLKHEYDWKVLSGIVCYKKKLIISTAKGIYKLKFSGMYGSNAARRLLDDMLECRLYNNCSLTGTNPLSYHAEENKRNEANFSRRSSKFRSFRNEPVMQRQGSIRRVYSSIRSRVSKNREKTIPNDGVSEEDLGYRPRPLSRIEILPSS